MTALIVCLVASACGERASSGEPGAGGSPPGRSADPDELPAGIVPDNYDGLFRVTATVLESPDHGPQLCATVMESYPPQCGGPDVRGWRWDDVQAESASGTTWGEYTLTGHFAHGTFTLSEPAQPVGQLPSHELGPASPCPEPTGGWVPPEPEKANPEAQQEAMDLARQSGGYGGVWIGWLIPDDQITEANSQDPANSVLNVSTTGDAAALERTLRDVWGGNLCVVSTKRTEAELNHIANQLNKLPGFVSSSADIVKGTADATVWVAWESIWRQATEEFGKDVIELNGMLQPIN